MIRLDVDILDVSIRFGVRLVDTASQIKRNIQEIDLLVIGFNNYLQSVVFKDGI